MLSRKWEREIEYVVNRLLTFAEYLEELGYKEVVGKSGRPKYQIDHIGDVDFPPINLELRKEYLWATTMALRNGCRIAEKLRVDPHLIEKATRLRQEIWDLSPSSIKLVRTVIHAVRTIMDVENPKEPSRNRSTLNIPNSNPLLAGHIWMAFI